MILIIRFSDIIKLRSQDVETQSQYLVGKPYPENSNSRLLFGSASKLVKKGWKEGIQREDLWRLDEDDSARGLWTNFEPIWSDELKKPKYVTVSNP
jgi:hypothetical protein